MESFMEIPQSQRILESEHFFVISDRYPVSQGHCLIISKSRSRTFFDLSAPEKQELVTVIDDVKRLLDKDDPADGYNIGMNCGPAAGQTIQHFHCHVIPRYWGDMDNPRGGVRHCIPEKGLY